MHVSWGTLKWMVEASGGASSMTLDIEGLRCASVRRMHHRFPGDPPTSSGPVEFGWTGGRYLTLDVNSDWTLNVSERRWEDPLGGVAPHERLELSHIVGFWEIESSPSDLASVVSQRLSEIDTIFNEVGELVGLRLVFEDRVIRAEMYAGDLTVMAEVI